MVWKIWMMLQICNFRNHIFHNINKWVKKDVSKLLETLLKPFDKQCVKKTEQLNH